MVDGSNLDLDLLILIAEKIEYYEDFKSFGGVCKGWRRLIEHASEPSSSRQTPWLMVPKRDHDDNSKFRYYDLNKRMILEKQSPVFLPRWGGVRSIGDYSVCGHVFSSRGWLIICGAEHQTGIVLVHPLFKMVIEPPKIKPPLVWRFIALRAKGLKFCLSEDPLSTFSYILFINYPGSCDFAFWRSGDKEWNFINHSRDVGYGTTSDFTFYKGDLYSIGSFGKILATSKSKPLKVPRVMTESDPAVSSVSPSKWYLVGSSNVLFRIKREFHLDSTENCIRTRSFIVWEVKVESWETKRVNSLRNNAVFIGLRSSSFSIQALPSANCKPNCIYYTNPNSSGASIWVSLI